MSSEECVLYCLGSGHFSMQACSAMQFLWSQIHNPQKMRRIAVEEIASTEIAARGKDCLG